MKLVKRTVRKYGEEYGPETIEKYDLKGHPTYRKTLNKEERFSYDESGNLICKIIDVVDGWHIEEWAKYDKNGCVIYRTTEEHKDGKAEEITEYHYRYDSNHKIIYYKMVYTKKGCVVREEEDCYEYNQRGQLVHRLSMDGYEECYKYGNRGELIRRIKNSGIDFPHEKFYEYDSFGRLVSSNDCGIVENCEYTVETENGLTFPNQLVLFGRVSYIDDLPLSGIEIGQMCVVVNDITRAEAEVNETPEFVNVVYIWDGGDWLRTSITEPEYGENGMVLDEKYGGESL